MFQISKLDLEALNFIQFNESNPEIWVTQPKSIRILFWAGLLIRVWFWFTYMQLESGAWAGEVPDPTHLEL